jgi:tight adherence protein B
MPFDIEPIYLFYLFVAASAGLAAEAAYLLFFSKASYRSRINRRLKLSKNRTDRESILVELRRERGLTAGGNYRLGVISLNRLILQSGLTLGFARLILIFAIGAVVAFAATLVLRGDLIEALLAAMFTAFVLPFMVLSMLRSRRRKKFGAQFPDAIDVIVRSLRAGHPVPIAISMVAREMPDPIGSEFGIVVDEVTYGLDLQEAIDNMNERIDLPDLRYMTVAISIQYNSGGNLAEILAGLSKVIRERFQMFRKIKAVSAEGRLSAVFLSVFPFILAALLWTINPTYYSQVADDPLFPFLAGMTVVLLIVNIFVMRWLVNFRV